VQHDDNDKATNEWEARQYQLMNINTKSTGACLIVAFRESTDKEWVKIPKPKPKPKEEKANAKRGRSPSRSPSSIAKHSSTSLSSGGAKDGRKETNDLR
jgi:hypothetical protein